MSGLDVTVASVLVNRFYANARRIQEMASPLTEAQFWQKPFPFGNSFGHLVLHLTGNLNYYIGAQIAQTGYVRDRTREFSEGSPPSKTKTLQGFIDSVAMVVRTIQSQGVDDWSAAYSATGSDCQNRLAMVVQCAAHMQHHIGQMIYIDYELKRQQSG